MVPRGSTLVFHSCFTSIRLHRELHPQAAGHAQHTDAGLRPPPSAADGVDRATEQPFASDAGCPSLFLWLCHASRRLRWSARHELFRSCDLMQIAMRA